MVKWSRLLCLIAYGVMLANVGTKIYEKYNKNTVEPPQKPEFWFAKTKSNPECKMYINLFENNTVGFEEFIAAHQAVAYRHLHNETAEIECFLKTETDKDKLVKYTRTDNSSDVIEIAYYFERREKKEKDHCYKHEYHLTLRKLEGGIVNRDATLKCHPKKEQEPVQEQKPLSHSNKDSDFPSYEVLFTAVIFSFAVFVYSFKTKYDKFKAKTAASDENIVPSAGSTTRPIPDQEEDHHTKSAEVPKAHFTTYHPKSGAAILRTPEVAEDDNISNTPEEIAVFTVPEPVDLQSEVESDTEESEKEASEENNKDQLKPVNMDISSDDSSFEHVN